jgi:hypothetical protein
MTLFEGGHDHMRDVSHNAVMIKLISYLEKYMDMCKPLLNPPPFFMVCGLLG